MSYSNTTPNYKLPIFSPEDKPSWLGAWNTAMTNIDTGMFNGVSATDLIKEQVNQMQTSVTTAEGNISDIQEDIENINTKIQGVESVTYYPVPSTSFNTVVPTEITAGETNTKVSLDAYAGGFVRLSLTNAIADTNVHRIVSTLYIDGVAVNRDNYCDKKVSSTSPVMTPSHFIPPNTGNFYFEVSIDNTAPEAANITLLIAPYKTMSVPVVKEMS